ncbi:MAG: carboxypeptidase regulatory-like domain-containing protein [Planctomycetes bacterium]|nr:carboxypeptidase regulatory-like domain-containing protein [Planctomycetota bacterium]
MSRSRRSLLALATGIGVVIVVLLAFPGRLDPDDPPARGEETPGKAAPSAAAQAPVQGGALDRAEELERSSAGSAPPRANGGAAATTPAAREEPIGAAATAPIVRGRVLDARSDAPVTRFELDGERVETPDGRFERSAPRGFTIEARGYRAWTCSDAQVRELARDEAVVRLEPDPDVGTCVVRVRDARGAPLAGVELVSSRPVRVRERTDEHGVCVLEQLPTRAFELDVRHAGWSEARVPVRVEPGGRTERVVVLQRSAPVPVRVLDVEGGLARHASIRVECVDEPNRAGRWRPARPRADEIDGLPFLTGDDFELALDEAEGRIEGLPPGRYVLHVTERSGVHREAPLQLAVPFTAGPAEPQELVVRLDADAPR